MDTDEFQKQYDELCTYFANHDWTEAIAKGKDLAGNYYAPRFYQVQAAIIVAQAIDTFEDGETWLGIADTLLLGWRYQYAPWTEKIVTKELADHWKEVGQQLEVVKRGFEEEEDEPEAAEAADLDLLKVLGPISNVNPVVVVAGDVPYVAETASVAGSHTASENHQIATPTHAPSDPLDTEFIAETQIATGGDEIATPTHARPDSFGTIIGLHTPAFDPSNTDMFGTATIIPLRPARAEAGEASREGVRISTILRDGGWTDEIQPLPGLTTQPSAEESVAEPSRAPQIQQQSADPDPLAAGSTTQLSGSRFAAGSRSMPQLQHDPAGSGPSATGT